MAKMARKSCLLGTPIRQVSALFHQHIKTALVRFQQLMILGPCLHPNATPLSVYWSTSARCVKLITADDIEHFIRRLAVVVYHLDPVKDEFQRPPPLELPLSPRWRVCCPPCYGVLST
jgi:hypothetical protein